MEVFVRHLDSIFLVVFELDQLAFPYSAVRRSIRNDKEMKFFIIYPSIAPRVTFARYIPTWWPV